MLVVDGTTVLLLCTIRSSSSVASGRNLRVPLMGFLLRGGRAPRIDPHQDRCRYSERHRPSSPGYSILSSSRSSLVRGLGRARRLLATARFSHDGGDPV